MQTTTRITKADSTIVTLTMREVYSEWVSIGDVEITSDEMSEACDLIKTTCYVIMQRAVGYGWAHSFLDIDRASYFNCQRRFFVLTPFGREQMIKCLSRPRRP